MNQLYCFSLKYPNICSCSGKIWNNLEKNIKTGRITKTKDRDEDFFHEASLTDERTARNLASNERFTSPEKTMNQEYYWDGTLTKAKTEVKAVKSLKKIKNAERVKTVLDMNQSSVTVKRKPRSYSTKIISDNANNKQLLGFKEENSCCNVVEIKVTTLSWIGGSSKKINRLPNLEIGSRWIYRNTTQICV